MKIPVSRLVLLGVLAACTRAPEEEHKTLATVSEEITFKSVASLGPHYSIATITRTDTWTNGERNIQSETVELSWNNWNSFHFRRLVDGEISYEAVVNEGIGASRTGSGTWRKDFDGEAARLDVHTAWNAWDEALEGFSNRIHLEELGPSTVDGRPTRRYRISLDPDPPKKRRSKRTLTPTELTGDVFVDEGTAVRLATDVRGTSIQGERERTVALHIRRSRIGEEQPIETPAIPTGKPSDALRRMPKNPNARP